LFLNGKVSMFYLCRLFLRQITKIEGNGRIKTALGNFTLSICRIFLDGHQIQNVNSNILQLRRFSEERMLNYLMEKKENRLG